MHWAALAAARHAATARVPWFIGELRVGSIDRRHLPALASLAAIDDTLIIGDASVAMAPALARAADRSAALAWINRALRDAGLITAWRDETYAIVLRRGEAPLALIERAAARFWGTLTFGAHCNGYLADAGGCPTHLWLARRALTKSTDPGLLDNLVGGGVPYGQTPREALLREGFEEAGLDAATMRRATPGSVLELARDIAEGFMHEQLHVFDLRLPAGLMPVNQDGEVAELRLVTVEQAIALAAGDAMTVDASLVTLDFALRHRLLAAPDAASLAARFASIVTGP